MSLKDFEFSLNRVRRGILLLEDKVLRHVWKEAYRIYRFSESILLIDAMVDKARIFVT
ncbi:hypothetical protein CBM2634_A10130 [Cupriavidus taiwanensis]|uniref:Uncharacterized protein n=1 Tax=Cupriavidus taiwanensis TaxID=164546 RepID=A0A375ITL5_9BURK|nr:hypothetical protein CBM2634_A10130 [Cupriavidus taiwanensis]